MKKIVKALAICIFAAILLGALVSCGEENSGATTNVKITITAGDTVILKDVDVAVVSDEPTVLLAFQQAMDDDNEFPDVVFEEDDEGNLLGIKDIGEFKDSTEKYWEFRVNDKTFSEMKGRASDYKIKEGDQTFFEYGAAANEAAES